MTIKNSKKGITPRIHQRGISLFFVLIFTLLLSMLAAFSARNVGLLEKQASNEMEYQVARQAAEAALRDAEKDLNIPNISGTCSRSDLRKSGTVDINEFDNSCTLGQCAATSTRYTVAWTDAKTDTPGAPWWPNSKGGSWGNNVSGCSFNGGVPLGTFTGTPKFPGVVRQPEYLIEYIPPDLYGANVATSMHECESRASAGDTGVYAAANESKGKSGAFRGKCHLFRINARGFGSSQKDNDIGNNPNPKVEVLLQSYFQLFIK
jgi:type IV pilus assembly protein PilX